MPHNLLDDYLKQVLYSFCRDHLPPIVQEALLTLPQHIIHCLQGCPPVSTQLSEPAFQSGPFARQTDINFGLEMEVTVPVTGLPARELAEFRQQVKACLLQAFPSNEASLKQDAGLIRLQFLKGPGTVLLQVISLEQQAELQFLKTHLQALAEADELLRQAVRLLKCWAHCQGLQVPALELEKRILAVTAPHQTLKSLLLAGRWPGKPEGFGPLWQALENRDLEWLYNGFRISPASQGII